MKRFLQAGRLNSPRGLKGEVKFDCWCDSPEFLIGVKKLYLDDNGERFLTVKLLRETIPSIIFEGYEDRSSASSLTGRTVYFDRNDIELEEGVIFNDDLISLSVYDDETGEKIGVLERIDEGVSCNYYFVKGENGNYLIPARDEFITQVSLETGIRVKLIEGLMIATRDID
ncbi:MAG: 16S rRNA processing protein RimM [Firmicutes bacterium HGW-Firmicutes-21]|nr:MAG: 16S rRNA processing protein RimM [Firmicutes bacterium HGW-Firmicutes-21]